jgi:hypothetical protein
VPNKKKKGKRKEGKKGKRKILHGKYLHYVKSLQRVQILKITNDGALLPLQ